MISELPLQRIKVLTDLALEKLKSYIAQKYDQQTHVQKAMVLSHAIHRIIDRHLPRYGSSTRDQIRKNVIARALDRSSFNIDCSHLFRSMVQLKRTGDDDFYNVLAGWWTDKTHDRVEPWELYHYVQSNPELLEPDLRVSDKAPSVLDKPLTRTEEEAFVMFKATEPRLSPPVERKLPGVGRKPPGEERKLLAFSNGKLNESRLADSEAPHPTDTRLKTPQSAKAHTPEMPANGQKSFKPDSLMPHFQRRLIHPVDRHIVLESVYDQYCKEGRIEDDKKIRKRLNKKRPKPSMALKPRRPINKPAVYAGLSVLILLMLITAYLSIQSIIAQGQEADQEKKQTLESSGSNGANAISTYSEGTELVVSDEAVPAGSPESPPPDGLPLLTMEATAYDLSYASCKKHPDHPEYGITSTGTQAEAGRTVAVDPDIIPLGSKLYIYFPPDYAYLDGYYYAEDTGSLIQGMKIDIYMGEDEPGEKEAAENARQFGIRTVNVAVVDDAR